MNPISFSAPASRGRKSRAEKKEAFIGQESALSLADCQSVSESHNPVRAIKLYRFIEDAWRDGLRDWCRAAPEAAFQGVRNWLVVANAGQAHWLKQRALRDGDTLFGIRFLLPGSLRFELCALLGVGTHPLGRETLEFLLKLEDPEARSPGPRLHALERLRAAGWKTPAHPALERSRAWGPALDEELLFKAGMVSAPPLRTCFFGWDAAHWEYLPLLEAAARASRSCEVYQSMPRPSAEGLQQGWIKAVEARLKIAHAICRGSDFVSPNEGLVARLEGVDLEATVQGPPRFLVGGDWRDHILLVRDYVIEKLAASGGGRVGIVAPRRSPSSLEIARVLAEAGVALFDETGGRREPEPAVLIQLQIARYHLLGCDVQELLALAALLGDNPGGARRRMEEAFQRMQTRNARLLVQAFDEDAGRTGRLVEALGSWEGEMTWNQAREKWEDCLRALDVDAGSLEPQWSLAGGLAGGAPMPGGVFLEYLETILTAPKFERIADSPYSAVVVTTFPQARGQAWDGLVFLDSNEGEWPVRPEENPYLDDARCRELNSRKSSRHGYLLDSGELAAVEQSHFLDLLENCGGEIAFASVSAGAYPNEWVIRALVESGEPAVLDFWQNALSVCPRPPATLPGRERLACVHARRRDPKIPFDEYLFNFRGSSFVPGEWSATDLDKAARTPATFAIRKIFGAESAGEFLRDERSAVGGRAHEWLREALGGGIEFAAFHPSARLAVAVAERAETDLAERFGRERLALPLWWKSALRKAAWNAWRCLAALPAGGGFFLMEYTLNGDIATSGGPLKLRGRVDLLLSDRPAVESAAVQVIDFKTGKSKPPTLSRLDKGEGFQFAAYFLLAKEAGAASASVGIVRPAGGFSPVFGEGDEMELRIKAGALAALQSNLDFGQLGPLVAEWGASEDLPMATTPISPRVLEAKAALRAFTVSGIDLRKT